MNFFVTGVTGNVGSAILHRLLATTDAQVWVLIRAADAEKLRARLDDVFRLWGPQALDNTAWRGRVHAVAGDMGLPNFGMSDADWQAVVAACSYIVHAAGVVRMNLPLDEARQHAVGSARNVIALAEGVTAQGRDASVAFVSTVGVAGNMVGSLTDSWVTEPRTFHNTYEQAKAEAEDLLRTWQRPATVHLTVHRPSMVVGASDGDILRHQIFFYLCEFLSGRHTKGLQPALAGACLDTVPVDYVADAVAWAVQSRAVDGRIFNLCSGSDMEVELTRVQQWTRDALRRNRDARLPSIRQLPAGLFMLIMRMVTLTAPADVKRRMNTLPMLLEYLKSPQTFDGRSTRHFLQSQAAIELPAAEAYLPGIIDSYFPK
ncbi:MAG: SDR family oxidoreductase [Gammaproteobacteria bacterium]|nr:SDR family oxidoreductase [Gammaproteobacteria bacterium]